MNYGYLGMSTMLFLQLGFVWVTLCALAYTGAFLIGPRKGGHTALKYTNLLTIVFIAGLAAIAGVGYLSGDLERFLVSWGIAPLLEMSILAFGWVGVMWFMAVQYGRGRIALDERFGSVERRRAAMQAAKEAQQRVYAQALQDGAKQQPDSCDRKD